MRTVEHRCPKTTQIVSPTRFANILLPGSELACADKPYGRNFSSQKPMGTNQKRPTEVSPCCYELPRIDWLREKDLNFGL